ncbi:N-acyl homoserine lactonase family protein [Isoptericola cucumis]|uniref:N-acyl homoserine lactonase family protein n=1 Tax=Isoptericola cucumis TaxID=1776856 RepID=UPI00320870A1
MTAAPDGAYALRYASRTVSTRGEHFYGHPDGCLDDWPIDYFTWVVLDADRTVVVDTGFTPQTALERGDRPYAATPPQLLERLGRTAGDVTDVVLTHLHYDHTGHLDAYPGARIWLQRRELDFWSSPLASRPGFAHLRHDADLARLAGLVEAGRVELLDGDARLSDRIGLHLVGGHTPGMQVVRAATDDGLVVLASDASHFYANYENDHPYGVVYHLEDMHLAFDRLRELAGTDGVVVPGHDPRVAERFPPVPGGEALVLHLTPRHLAVNHEGAVHAQQR